MCAELKRTTGVCCPSDATKKLPYCTRSDISQAASAVLLTVVLRDFLCVSSKQAVLHCSEPSGIALY